MTDDKSFCKTQAREIWTKCPHNRRRSATGTPSDALYDLVDIELAQTAPEDLHQIVLSAPSSTKVTMYGMSPQEALRLMARQCLIAQLHEFMGIPADTAFELSAV